MTASGPLRILGKASSINVRKVLWTCIELDLPHVREDWGSGFAPTDTPGFLAMNPQGLVPVLQVGADFLWESNTICRYLASGSELLPSAPLARAHVEKWMDWQATELNGAWRYAFMALVCRHPDFTDPRQIEAGIAGWNCQMGILERRLQQTGAFVAGAAFTLADVVLGLSVNRWRLTPMPRPDCPAIAAYEARLAQRPGYRRHGANGMP